MKKFMLLMVSAIVICFGASAQTVKSSNFFDNWQIGVRGGVTALLHPQCNGYEDFGHTIQASTSLDITKYITPVFGLGVQSTIGWENGSQPGDFQGRNWLNYVNVLANGKVNLNNLFAGYKGSPRPFEVVAVAGIGWNHGFIYAQDAEYYYFGTTMHTNDIITKFGVEFNVNLNDRFQINIVPSIAYNLTNANGYQHVNSPAFDSRNAWVGLEAGVTYKFKNHYGSHNFELCEFTHTQAEIDELNAKINELRGQKPEVVEKIVTKEVVKTVTERTGDVIVFFANNSSYLNDIATATLDRIPTDAAVKIVGKASIDGTFERNMDLSVERADAVRRYLENRGVKVVKSTGIGASEGDASGRVVVVTLQ